MFRFVKPTYNREKLAQTWNEVGYDHYKTATWDWEQFPLFNNRDTIFTPPSSPIDGTVLEIGCAYSAAFNFLKNQVGISDESKYYGFDISTKGIEYCKNIYKNTSWLQTDLTKHTFTEKFDYGFERIAIHHMPDPLSIFDKVLKTIKKSFATNFVCCVDGDTISDLNLARYRADSGEFYYFNIINVFQVLEIMLENGFNQIATKILKHLSDQLQRMH